MDSWAEANDALVRAFMEAWERRDIAEDAVYQSVPLSPIEGKGAVAAWVRGFTEKPPGRLAVRHQVASRDVVMNERTDVIALNGRTVTQPICAVFEMHGGHIAAWREYLDLTPARAAYEGT